MSITSTITVRPMQIDEDGTTYYTDEAQEKFNEFYDFVEDVIVSNLMLERLEDSNWKVKEEVNG